MIHTYRVHREMKQRFSKTMMLHTDHMFFKVHLCNKKTTQNYIKCKNKTVQTLQDKENLKSAEAWGYHAIKFIF